MNLAGGTLQDGGAGDTLANAVNITGNITFGSAGSGSLTLGPQTLATPNTVAITGSPTIYVTAPTTVADQVTGALVKDGPSTLTLTAPTNTLTGTTLVNGGSLVGTVANLATPVTLANGANVTFYQAADATLTAPINGTGSLGKTGTGVLTLGGFNAYVGTTTINAGTLRLTTFIPNPGLTVDYKLAGTAGSALADGTVIADLSGCGNNGTMVGSGSYVTAPYVPGSPSPASTSRDRT